jgi:very-short-patch-repair endonuclease
MRSRYRRGLLEGITRERAREMRKNPTAPERVLWARLRRQRLGARFRRQYPLLGFFPDFCCVERRLVIEIDGDSHAEQPQYDAWRTEKLAERGFRVLRFFNDEVQTNLEGVVEAIYEAVRASSATPSLALPRVKQRVRGEE